MLVFEYTNILDSEIQNVVFGFFLCAVCFQKKVFMLVKVIQNCKYTICETKS